MTGPVRVVFGHTADLSGLGKAAPLPEVHFTMMSAGLTEFVTADGWRVQLRLKVKAVRRKSTDSHGAPVYDLDLEHLPVMSPVLTVTGRALGETEN